MFTKYAVVLLRGTEKKIIAFNDLNSAREKASAFHKRYEKCYIRVDIIPFKTPELCDFDHYDMSITFPKKSPRVCAEWNGIIKMDIKEFKKSLVNVHLGTRELKKSENYTIE